MAQLKEKVLRSLQDSKQLETTLQDFSKFGDNLLKNYSNPTFNKKDKAEILKSYMDLQNLGKSLYRYGILKENNYLADANEEQENIENTVLKGGVSYNRYIWRSENGENTCDECRVLDGQTFDFYDEVPERPHPNCKCSVEIINDEETNSQKPKDKEDEQCDVIEQLDVFISEIEEIVQEMNTVTDELQSGIKELENDEEKLNNIILENNETLEVLGKEYGKHLPDCENNVDEDYLYIQNQQITLKILLSDVQNLHEMGFVGYATLAIFISNYLALLYNAYLLRNYEMDKYYHSKANCEAVQLFGDLGEEAASLLSNSKEEFDHYQNFYAKSHKVSIEQAIEDSLRDQKANKLGRERGRKYPNCKCYNLMNDLKPEN